MKPNLLKSKMFVKALLVLCLLFWANSAFAELYRKPIPSLPITFDPKRYTDAYSVLVSTQIYDRLFDFDEMQNTKANLAEKWEVTEGGRVWTIHLRKNVKFHDGKPLTAEDIEFTLYRLIESDSVKSREFSIVAGADEYSKKRVKGVSGIKVISSDVIRIELKMPFPVFPAILSSTNTEILPKDFGGRSEADFFRHPVGTGPFKFESFEPNARVTLAANESYFLGKPYLEKIIFERSDTENAVKGFNVGYYQDLEWYFNVDPRRLTTTYTMIKTPIPEVSVIGFNTRRAPLNNAHVRRAMYYAIDRKKLLDECFPGRKFAAGYIPPGVGGYYPEMQDIPFDLGKAKEEISLSKVPLTDLARPMILYRPDNHPCTDKFGPFIETSLKKIGMTIAVKNVSLGELHKLYYSPRNFDIINMIYSADYPEALFLLNYFISNNPRNYSGFKSKSFDDLLTRAGAVEDRHERFNLYRKAQEILQQEAAMVPIFYDIYECIYQKNVRGIKASPYISYLTSMKSIYFDKDQPSSQKQ